MFLKACNILSKINRVSIKRTFVGNIQSQAKFSTSTRRNEAQTISGTKLAGDIHKEVKEEISDWVKEGAQAPHLVAVLVGEDPASATYIKNKVKACTKVGITSDTINKDTNLTQPELLSIVEELNNDNNVDGILVQLPLPPQIDERTACNAITPGKDVDGFHITNIGKLCLDQNCLMPATPAGVWEMIKRSGVETFAKIALVCGRSKNVGMPMAMLLHTDHRHERPGGDATVIQTHRYTPRDQLASLAKQADIIIAAAGIPGLITADMVKEGACVIDVGINRIKDKTTGKFKLVGDVDFEEVKKVAGHITPVPGGVGPMTVAMLCKNTLEAAKNRRK